MTLSALHPPRDTRRFDGFLLGKSGLPVSPDQPLPEPVGQGDKVVYFVNGINTDISKQMGDMKRIAEKLGCRVVGIHNATAGHARDLAECVGDKLGLGDNPAVQTVKELLSQGLRAGIEVSMLGHSQGALILSRAVNELQADDRLQGLGQKELQEKYSQVEIQTAAGAAYTYPEGPRYHHLVNNYDPIPALFGNALAGTVERFQRWQSPYVTGEESLLDILPLLVDRSVHGTEVYYSPER